MSLKRMASTVLAAALTVGLAGAASAQGWGGGMRGGGPGGASPRMSNPMGLLQRTEVQTHLRLTLKQKNELNGLNEQSRSLMRERMQGMFRGQNEQGGQNNNS